MKKTIALDEILDLPNEIFSKRFNEGDLHIAKENPSWILTNTTESAILKQLINHKTIREAVNHLMLKRNFNTRELETNTKSLLQKLEAFGFYEGATVPDDGKLALHLYLTNRCNLSCIHCYKDAGKGYDNELTSNEIKTLIDGFSEQGKTQVVLSGGEVLLRKDFFEIAEHIKSEGHQVNVVTNGTLIKDKEIATRLAEVTDFLQISLDGASKEVNDYFRGKGTYEKVINAINLFSGTDHLVNIGMVVSKDNFEDIKSNLALLLNEKIKHNKIKINVSGMMGYGRGNSCSYKDSSEYVDELFKIAPELGIKPKQWRLPNTKAFDCGYARSITVDADGDVYYCPVANEYLKSGFDIRETSTHEIMEHFRLKNKEISVENMKECGGCELEYLCGGGCRLENQMKRGNLLKPECSPERKDLIYRELIKLRMD